MSGNYQTARSNPYNTNGTAIQYPSKDSKNSKGGPKPVSPQILRALNHPVPGVTHLINPKLPGGRTGTCSWEGRDGSNNSSGLLASGSSEYNIPKVKRGMLMPIGSTSENKFKSISECERDKKLEVFEKFRPRLDVEMFQAEKGNKGGASAGFGGPMGGNNNNMINTGIPVKKSQAELDKEKERDKEEEKLPYPRPHFPYLHDCYDEKTGTKILSPSFLYPGCSVDEYRNASTELRLMNDEFLFRPVDDNSLCLCTGLRCRVCGTALTTRNFCRAPTRNDDLYCTKHFDMVAEHCFGGINEELDGKYRGNDRKKLHKENKTSWAEVERLRLEREKKKEIEDRLLKGRKAGGK